MRLTWAHVATGALTAVVAVGLLAMPSRLLGPDRAHLAPIDLPQAAMPAVVIAAVPAPEVHRAPVPPSRPTAELASVVVAHRVRVTHPAPSAHKPAARTRPVTHRHASRESLAGRSLPTPASPGIRHLPLPRDEARPALVSVATPAPAPAPAPAAPAPPASNTPAPTATRVFADTRAAPVVADQSDDEEGPGHGNGNGNAYGHEKEHGPGQDDTQGHGHGNGHTK